jgi:signal transduction histidine kinase
MFQQVQLIIVFILLTSVCSASITDSLWDEYRSASNDTTRLQALLEYSVELRRINPDSCIVIAYKGIEECEELNFSNLALSFEYMVAISYIRKASGNKAVSVFKTILSKLENESLDKDNELKAAIYNTLGSIYRTSEKLDSAVYFLEKAKEILDSTKYLHNRITNMNDLAMLNIDLGRIKSGIGLLQNSFDLAIQNEMFYLAFFTKSLYLRNTYYSNSLYTNRNIHDTLELILSRIENESEKGSSLIQLGITYWELNNYLLAEKFLKQSLEYSLANKNSDVAIKSYWYLDSLYLRLNDSKAAYENLGNFFSFKDSINNIKLEQKIEYLNAKHENKLNLNKITHLERINVINYRLTITFAIIGAILLTLLLLIYYIYRQNKNKSHELEILNNTKDRFFSIISHDLKGPANSTMTLAKMLNKEYDAFDENDIKESIELLDESSTNLSKLLENLLTWSRAQMGEVKFNLTLSKILPVINDSIEPLLPIAKQKDININVDILNDDLVCYFDNESITFVIRNLVSNSIKFTPVDGKIDIKIIEQYNEISISVIDNGVGMSEQVIERLFKVDHKITSIGTKGEKGTGLGLILCKEFVEKNNGKMSVESEINKGSIFKFSLIQTSFN